MMLQTSICWEEANQRCEVHWHSENGVSPHQRIVIADDTLTADKAYRIACEGTAILWRGDFQNARQLLQAMARRVARPSKKSKRVAKKAEDGDRKKASLDIFNQYRLTQSQHARILGMLLIQCNGDHSISLRRAPDIAQACLEAYGNVSQAYIVSLRELLGVISAHEWRKKGVPILTHNTEEFRIHPHYGVFSPIRGEYIELVRDAPLPKCLDQESTAFDIGVGTGVLSILLTMRGVHKVIGTDQDERALRCARENVGRLGLATQIEIIKANLFPGGKAALIICNPPWLPARPSSSLEHAIYDLESQMLKGFLTGLKDHLLPNGEGWLILSDLAEHLELRTRAELLELIEQAGLMISGRVDIKPKHNKAFNQSDMLYFARTAEVTSLWRLIVK